MKRPDPQSGFSIIDMIVGLSILAVAIVGIMIVQQNYIQMSSNVELGLRAISLGNSVMNTIRMHAYDENASSPWSSTIGANTDAGESALADYDDIDDYAGATWDFSSDGYLGYSVTTRVFYIDIATSWVDSVGPTTSFKRIIVRVDHSDMESPVVFSSLVAGI
ncbi:MAG: hypothetical protein L3J79_01960 [Candidatus Marinimicrobia bacterium]|nr:hypothetical protein [Candidatus Neomarinimicrobiota bacterium]